MQRRSTTVREPPQSTASEPVTERCPRPDSLADSGERPTLAALLREPRPPGARYRRVGLLGEGGMGEVHLCDDRKLRRQVALKKLHAAAAAKVDERARFTREALAQRQLEHPAIVPVHDVGLDEDGSPYFTMRRIRGTTLEEILSEQESEGAGAGEYSRHKLLCAFTKVCLAVDYAHDRGILHCDLKPANIMLGPYGEVYVLDWGLAREIGEVTEVSPSGTAGFMAPEVLRCRVPDARSDVYSLGSMLYELLTLCPLHAGDEIVAIMYSTLAGDVVAPSVRAPWRRIAPELDAICLRATALDPDARYQTARALHDAVERFLEGPL